ncbi:ferritin-like domain-containing protein [Halobellus sp. GM3]|uniref:ferritin-like domain-containing protein n=1 Tax=Halobellus sp. GM3 TaxID=3458410 RepID=UPI00403D6EA3
MTGPTDPETRAERIAASVKKQLGEQDSSRRSFLGRSALVGGTLLALGSASGSVLAQDDEEDTEPEAEMAPAFDDVDGTDIDVLNYALSLEHLENAFYREGLETFDEDDFVDADSLDSYSEEIRMDVYSNVEIIGEHESIHVDVLTQAVELLGGTPAEEASYDFGVETVEDFLGIAQVLENTGVAAYAGAAPFVESPDLLSAALSIHSVEARHAALLNEVTGEPPFPDAFDAAQSQQDVLDAITPFVVSEETEDGEEDEEEEETAEDGEETAEDGEETETETTTETDEPTPFGDENETATDANETTTIFETETE